MYQLLNTNSQFQCFSLCPRTQHVRSWGTVRPRIAQEQNSATESLTGFQSAADLIRTVVLDMPTVWDILSVSVTESCDSRKSKLNCSEKSSRASIGLQCGLRLGKGSGSIKALPCYQGAVPQERREPQGPLRDLVPSSGPDSVRSTGLSSRHDLTHVYEGFMAELSSTAVSSQSQAKGLLIRSSISVQRSP